MLWLIGITWALSSSIILALLLYLFFTRRKNFYFYFALVFLFAHFSGIEWAMFLLGKNFFEMVTKIFPLFVYFVSWMAFIIYISERILKNRKLTVLIIIATILIFIFAPKCMNYPYDCKLLGIKP